MFICIFISSISTMCSNYSPRLTEPDKTQYYYGDNVFQKSGYGMWTSSGVRRGNCTAYAWGRAYELLGTKPKLGTGNAGSWWNYNKNTGAYPYGTEPRLGAVAVWDKYDNNQGHVAVVEKIDGDNVTISESHWDSTFFDIRTIKKDSSNYATSMRFLGYIYIGEWEVYTTPPNNVVLSKNQYWYDIKDTIELTPSANGAQSYYMSICREDGTCVVGTGLNGTYKIAANELGFGSYHAWISATNNIGSTDSPGCDFSVVGPPGYSTVKTSKGIYSLDETVSVSVDTVCAKGQTIGIDKADVGRVVTKECDPTYTQPARELGVGRYSAYFSIYNGSGGVDTKRTEFQIVDAQSVENLGTEFYAYIEQQESGLYLTNQTPNVAAEKAVGDSSQIWKFKRLPTGAYIIESKYNGYVLDVFGADEYDNTNVYTWKEYTEGNNQQFYIFKKNGAYYISPAHCSGRMLDVSPKEDHNLAIWKDKGNQVAQKFNIIKCSGIQYEIAYDANGGIGAPAKQQKGDKVSIILSAIKPTRKCKVTYNANGGAVSSASKTVESQFLGWAETKTASTAVYQPGAVFTKDADTTLYAVWKNPLYGTLPTPTRNGYKFLGWFTKAEGGAAITSKTELSKDMTIFAQWEKNPTNLPKITITSGTAKVGSIVDVYLKMENNPGVVAAAFEVAYDSGALRLMACEDLGVLDDHYFGDITQNPIRLTWEDPLATVNNTGNGNIAKMQFKVLKDLGANGSPINISLVSAYDVEFKDVAFATAGGIIKSSAYTPGDVNDDGVVNSKDAMLLRRYTVGFDVTLNKSAADVNKDSLVDSKDSMLLRKYTLGMDVVLK